CEDGNTADGDGCSSSCMTEISPTCGDGIIDIGEQCDDGNTLDGDGCALDCTFESSADLTHTGTIIARITSPSGGGASDPEVIRDGDKPPVGNSQSSRQYDTYSGGDFASEDWIGYEYVTDQLFGQVVFQEGRNFSDGGFFVWLVVQVRQGGTWVDAPGLTITPTYAGDDGNGFNTYVLDFDPTVGDAIRIYGPPGGAKYFTSVGELEVYAPELCANGVLDAGEACDDGNTTNGDGCSATCEIEPPPVCGDGKINPGEVCDDGNTLDGDGCSAFCAFESGTDLTQTGTIIARIMSPGGGGNKDPEVIRDGDKPPVGNSQSSRQYDTYSGGDFASEDWIGYEYVTDQLFGQMIFQEGKNFSDGGYFISLSVQVRQGGIWVDAPGLVISPTYAVNDGVHFNTYVLDFDPIVGDAIRIYGEPGGAKYFTSYGEVEVFTATVILCGNGVLDSGEQCDDGNQASGDGCSVACLNEFCGDGVVNDSGAEDCEPPGTATCTDLCTTRAPICGDGFRTPPEACDDGNTSSGDGCTSGCAVELCGDGVINNGGVEDCEPPGTATCTNTCTTRGASCGDGFLTAPEECEDGNTASGDGCTSGCVLEFCGDGIVNNGGSEACEPPGTAICTSLCTIRVPVCGDGFLTPPEECEDGNTANGDGCSATCTIEPPPACGDGNVDPGEECDDGNTVSGDGCTSICVIEVCGDGVVNNAGAEDCEPPGTGVCTDTCTTRVPLCGDGFLTAPEECEDGNTADGDGCSATCTIEVPPACGDGNLDAGEECDDGNNASGDGCTAACVIEVCGDGVVNNAGAEDCEPPGTAVCTDTCTTRAPLCGDGFITPPEQCEDGNTADGDGCSSSCMTEISPTCGDGIIDIGEQCD
ncbi:MAG: DUF4215 domain-containing protein, partial [Anderseniella sp.]